MMVSLLLFYASVPKWQISSKADGNKIFRLAEAKLKIFCLGFAESCLLVKASK